MLNNMTKHNESYPNQQPDNYENAHSEATELAERLRNNYENAHSEATVPELAERLGKFTLVEFDGGYFTLIPDGTDD